MKNQEQQNIPKKKKLPSARTIFLSILAGLLAGGGIVGLFLYLQQDTEPLPVHCITAEADPEESIFYKETDPPTEPTTEPPTTESIAYEMQIDLQKVQEHHAVNPDVIGWVYIQDTPINYPVVQYSDNAYYIDKNWQGQYSFSGCIFADYQCSIPLSQNSLLYGHNMGNGTMFHAVKYYKDAEWGNEHLYFEVATLGKRYLYKALSLNVLYGEAGAAFDYWNCVNMTRPKFEWFIQNIYETSDVWYGDAENLPEYGKDRIISLQTCNSGANDGMRCVLFAQCVGER